MRHLIHFPACKYISQSNKTYGKSGNFYCSIVLAYLYVLAFAKIFSLKNEQITSVWRRTSLKSVHVSLIDWQPHVVYSQNGYSPNKHPHILANYGPSKGVQVELTCEHLYFFNQFLKHKFIKIKACSYKVGFLNAQTIMQFLNFFIQITMYRHACLYKLEFI